MNDPDPFRNVELLHLSAIDSHFRGVIRTRWCQKNLSECDRVGKQMRGLIDDIPPDGPRNPWWISMKTIALAFGVKKFAVQRILDREKQLENGEVILPAHRSPKITDNQLQIVKEFIRKREVEEKDPPEPYEVCDFIESTFKITYSRSWINQLVADSKGFHLVDATPLENERIDVKVDDLRENHQKLSQKLLTLDPRFIVNIDECGWGKKISHGKKRVVSLNSVNTNYRERADEGHITMIPVSWANGDFSRTMVVIQTKSIERELVPFGLPDGPNVYVAASQKGYITQELFIKLIDKILIPDLNNRRTKFNMPNSKCLLIVDGATQHQSEDITKALEKANIELHFLVPHSSHLTQPLDCMFFKNLKSELRKNRAKYTDLSKSSNRLVHALSCLSKTTGWYIGLRSWHFAGFLVSLEKENPTVLYDLETILERRNSPAIEVKVKALKSKRKREKVFFSGAKKIKADEEKKSEEIKIQKKNE